MFIAHQYLHDIVRILHCDLSVNNVLLNRLDNGAEPLGLLIDFDYSVKVPQQGPDTTESVDDVPGQRAGGTSPGAGVVRTVCLVLCLGYQLIMYYQGTPPYMAIEALIDPDFIHGPHHDLESILYIIIYVCTFVCGPGAPLFESQIPRSMSLPIRTWYSRDRMKDIGFRKMSHLTRPDIAIIPKLTEYWADFAPFITELIEACFPTHPGNPNEFKYEQALEILERAINAVEEPSVAGEIQEVIGRPQKRQRNMPDVLQLSKKGKDA
jgi:serine/threonine protein kinase